MTSENPDNKNNLRIIEEPFDPFKIHPHGVFPSPVVEIEKSFSLSEKDLSVEVGKWPWLIDGSTGEPNTGNYVVLYRIRVRLLNDMKERNHIQIVFAPQNGISMGSVLVDGALMETGIVRQDERARLTTMELAPGESRQVEIITFPEAGSCYPVNIQFSRTREDEITEK